MLVKCRKMQAPPTGDFLGARHATTLKRMESAFFSAADDRRDGCRAPNELILMIGICHARLRKRLAADMKKPGGEHLLCWLAPGSVPLS